jgi:hypothetical protein
LVPDLQSAAARARWPLFTHAAATTLDVAAQFAFPLQVGLAQLGVLSCYRVTAGPLKHPRQVLATADLATLALLEIESPTRGIDSRFELFDPSWRGDSKVHLAVAFHDVGDATGRSGCGGVIKGAGLRLQHVKCEDTCRATPREARP